MRADEGRQVAQQSFQRQRRIEPNRQQSAIFQPLDMQPAAAGLHGLKTATLMQTLMAANEATWRLRCHDASSREVLENPTPEPLILVPGRAVCKPAV